MHEEDQKRKDRQEEDVKNQGYFVLNDGSKSTDEQNAPPKKRNFKSMSPDKKANLAKS